MQSPAKLCFAIGFQVALTAVFDTSLNRQDPPAIATLFIFSGCQAHLQTLCSAQRGCCMRWLGHQEALRGAEQTGLPGGEPGGGDGLAGAPPGVFWPPQFPHLPWRPLIPSFLPQNPCLYQSPWAQKHCPNPAAAAALPSGASAATCLLACIPLQPSGLLVLA